MMPRGHVANLPWKIPQTAQLVTGLGMIEPEVFYFGAEDFFRPLIFAFQNRQVFSTENIQQRHSADIVQQTRGMGALCPGLAAGDSDSLGNFRARQTV